LIVLSRKRRTLGSLHRRKDVDLAGRNTVRGCKLSEKGGGSRAAVKKLVQDVGGQRKKPEEKRLVYADE